MRSRVNTPIIHRVCKVKLIIILTLVLTFLLSAFMIAILQSNTSVPPVQKVMLTQEQQYQQDHLIARLSDIRQEKQSVTNCLQVIYSK